MLYVHASSSNMALGHKATLLIEKALEKFYENDLTIRMRKAMERLETTPTHIEVTDRFSMTWAEANFELKRNKKYRKFDYFILRAGTHLFDTKPSFQYEIISHEVAHLIQFSLEGDSYHDNMWKKLHYMMGGTGERLINEP